MIIIAFLQGTILCKVYLHFFNILNKILFYKNSIDMLYFIYFNYYFKNFESLKLKFFISLEYMLK